LGDTVVHLTTSPFAVSDGCRAGIGGQFKLSSRAESVGTIEVALAHASRLLQSDPKLAAEQAAEILKVAPGHPLATLLLASAQRSSGETDAALQILEQLTRAQPNWAAAHYELGLVLGRLDRHTDAITALRRAVTLRPDLPDAWRALGDQLTITGDGVEADACYAQHIKASTRDPRLLQPASALCENNIPVAESLLRTHLKAYPTDVVAIRMFAEVAARLGRFRDAENLLRRCLELAPSFHAARHNYALVLSRQNKAGEALREIDRLFAAERDNPAHRNLKAAVLAKIGELEESVEIYSDLLAQHPEQPKIWMSYGHALKTAGREAQSIEAYRKSIELRPSLGEAYWSLANLKTMRFSPADVEAMRAQLQRADLSPEERFHFDFALGKALEDAGSFEESFGHYLNGNALRRAGIEYSAERNTAQCMSNSALLTREFFAARQGFGSPAPDPIFIVGLPRSGSTLLEQILSSHSAVEGTMELPDIPGLAATLGREYRQEGNAPYPQLLAHLSADRCRALGEQYLTQTRIQRKTAAPYFIDKMPNNFAYIGLIQLILPNAKIIDARRHPLGCCFSCFKQHFARGQHFTYSLEDIGRYYHNYVGLMSHFDQVLPGRIHRVIYESMIEDTETQVRRLLEYCGLPFEPACLRFYENERAVRTASSQQVRQPIFRAGVDHWRHYEPWLDPLKAALGPVLAAYPDAPAA
jgi:predicted Zn-dependent protease